MSFGNIKIVNGVQEALTLAMLLVAMLAVFYLPDLDFTYKIAIAVFAFTIVMLINLATAILRQQKELRDRQMKQA